MKTVRWERYFGWEEFKEVEGEFTKLCEMAREDIGKIWNEFELK